jgi:proteasome lid subunit RPN8/RPN11
MNEPENFEIRIKPVIAKPKKQRLPGKVEGAYPTNLLVAFVRQDVMQRLREYASTALDYELGGVLVGHSGKSSRRSFILIEDFIPARKGVSRRASFEFTNEAQTEIHEVMESQFKGSQIVGWFHTHPGYGIFLSSADQFIDEHYFNGKFHVAMVLDPRKADVEVGVFVWDPDHNRVRVSCIEVD